MLIFSSIAFSAVFWISHGTGGADGAVETAGYCGRGSVVSVKCLRGCDWLLHWIFKVSAEVNIGACYFKSKSVERFQEKLTRLICWNSVFKDCKSVPEPWTVVFTWGDSGSSVFIWMNFYIAATLGRVTGYVCWLGLNMRKRIFIFDYYSLDPFLACGLNKKYVTLTLQNTHKSRLSI